MFQAGPHIENLLLRREGKLTREFYDEEDLLANVSRTNDSQSLNKQTSHMRLLLIYGHVVIWFYNFIG